MLIPFKTLLETYRIFPTGVLHLGANTGQERFDYRDSGIERVIWVECEVDTYARLLHNLKGFTGNMAIKACIGEVNGDKVKFNVANNEAQSSSYLEFGTHAVMHPECKYIASYELTTVRMDSVLKHNKIDIVQYDFINCDLQGADLIALKSLGKLLDKVKYIYIETNTDEVYKDCPHVTQIDAYLKPFGFERWCNAPNGNLTWTDSFYARRKDIYLPD